MTLPKDYGRLTSKKIQLRLPDGTQIEVRADHRGYYKASNLIRKEGAKIVFKEEKIDGN